MDLPEHIILYNILSRTPSKSLARFKCVSKHWNRMISDPEFMKSRSRRMILLPLLPFQAIDNNTKHEVDNMGADCYSTVKLVDAPFECEEISIVGTFSGIVLLVLNRDSFGEHMILYNPLTGAFKKLPGSPLSSHSMSNKSLFGIGYGTTPDDLKIVRLRFDGIYPTLSVSCELFGLKNGSWSSTPAAKLISDYSTFESYEGTSVNGCLYWLSYNRWTKESIVALDLNQMVFSEIEEVPSSDFASLGTLNGSLCVVCCKQTFNGVGIELWVMNKEGDGFAKTRRSFMSSTLDPHYWLYQRLSLGFKMSILDEQKILRFDGIRNKFVIIDMLKDSHKEVNTITSDMFGQASMSKAIEYVESWVSPSHLCSSLI